MCESKTYSREDNSSLKERIVTGFPTTSSGRVGAPRTFHAEECNSSWLEQSREKNGDDPRRIKKPYTDDSIRLRSDPCRLSFAANPRFVLDLADAPQW